MSRHILRIAALAMLALMGAFFSTPAGAETAPPDSVLDGYMRRMADSTSSYFGMTAELPDTAYGVAAFQDGKWAPYA